MRTRSSWWGRLTVIAITWLLAAAAHFVSEIKMVRAVKWFVVQSCKDIWLKINLTKIEKWWSPSFGNIDHFWRKKYVYFKRFTCLTCNTVRIHFFFTIFWAPRMKSEIQTLKNVSIPKFFDSIKFPHPSITVLLGTQQHPQHNRQRSLSKSPCGPPLLSR